MVLERSHLRGTFKEFCDFSCFLQCNFKEQLTTLLWILSFPFHSISLLSLSLPLPPTLLQPSPPYRRLSLPSISPPTHSIGQPANCSPFIATKNLPLPSRHLATSSHSLLANRSPFSVGVGDGVGEGGACPFLIYSAAVSVSLFCCLLIVSS